MSGVTRPVVGTEGKRRQFSPLDTWLAAFGYCAPLDETGSAHSVHVVTRVASAAGGTTELVECASASYIYLQCLWWGGGQLLGAPLTTAPPLGPLPPFVAEDRYNPSSVRRPASPRRPRGLAVLRPRCCSERLCSIEPAVRSG